MKTGKYYFGLMNPEEQKKFKANCGNTPTFDDVILREHPDFYTFLTVAFTWPTSPEGFEFWAKVRIKHKDE